MQSPGTALRDAKLGLTHNWPTAASNQYSTRFLIDWSEETWNRLHRVESNGDPLKPSVESLPFSKSVQPALRARKTGEARSTVNTGTVRVIRKTRFFRIMRITVTN